MLFTLVLWGCADPCPDTTTLESVDATTCDASGWHYEIETLGPSSSADLRIVQSAMEPDPIWVEQHTLLRVATDLELCTDVLERHLPVVDSWEDQECNTSTLFACVDESWLTFEVTVYDMEGVQADCVVWGHFPDDIGDPACRRLD